MNTQQSQLNKARADKFFLVFSVPKIIRENINTNDFSNRNIKNVIENSLQFSIFGSFVPEISIPSKTLKYSGQSFKVSSHVREIYSDVEVSFNIDNRFNNYWVIYKWLDILNNEKLSWYDAKNIDGDMELLMIDKNSKNPPLRYQTDMTVFGLDEYDHKVIEFTYKHAFPVKLGSIQYNYQTPNEISSSFTFSFAQLNVNIL